MNRCQPFALAALVALALAGCSVASSSPSGSNQDPATVVPSSALVYVSLPARLQSPEGPAFSAAVSHLFGDAAENKIQHLLNKLAASAHTTYAAGIRPWLGSHVGIALTQFPNLLSLVGTGGSGASESGAIGRAVAGGLAVIVPTDNPAAASKFLKLAEKSRIPAGFVTAVHGDDVLFGGQAAVSAVEHTTTSTSLADSAGYSSMLTRIGARPVASFYVAARLIKSYLPLIAAAGKAPANLLSTAEAKLNKLSGSAAELLSLTATDTTLRLDLLTTGYPETAQRVPANVGTLTGGSWLALSTGSVSNAAMLATSLKDGVSAGLAERRERLQELGSSASSDVAKIQRFAAIAEHGLGALGPISLSLSGVSVGHENLGFTMTSSSAAAAKQLLLPIFNLARSHASNDLQGSPTAFTMLTKHHQDLNVAEIDGRIQALIGYRNTAAFLNSGSTLANTANYRVADAQLPADAAVPLYVEFGPIASIVAASREKGVATLRKLSYLIVGRTPGDTRIVLGLN
jgi:hypothetical protein